MIFVTVGSQLPFDRLIKAVDEWAKHNQIERVYAQIGESDFVPQHIHYCSNLTPEEYNKELEKADFIVAHAGMGSIISALEQGKHILIMPRLAKFKEHRNDHQLTTAEHFAELNNICVANDEKELPLQLDKMLKEKVEYAKESGEKVSSELIQAIKDFVEQ